MSTADTTAHDEHGEEEHVHKLNLQVDIKDAGPCLKHVRVTIPRKDIEHFYEHAVEDMSGSAAVPGFRPGKVPKALVQKRFRGELKDQVKQRLLVESLEQLAEDNDLDPINEPNLDVTALDIPDEGDFEYEFDVEVRPDFEVPDYAGLKIERPKVEVTDAQVDAYLDRFLSQYGQLTPHEGKAEAGDHLTLRAKFTHDGKTLHEIDEFTARLRPVLRLRDAELDGFQELFAGAEIGEKREADLTVSPEAETIELRGETVHAELELLDLKRLERPEMNKTLLDRVGVESEDELKQNIRQTLERQAVYRERQFARTQVLSKITESANWDLPESLVTRQVENALRREMLEMQQAGFTIADIRARENQIRQNAITSTRQALKEHFVLDKIATKEEIEVGRQDIEQEIMLMAMQQGESPRRLRARLQKSGLIENLEAQLRERKAIDFILSKAEFVDAPTKADEPVDRIEAIPQSVCGLPVATAATDDEDEADEE
ncbi:MAG: trigger factor [Planctomycetota bacterium]|nr:trigger factor [Planctomycetaceae bacterium]MDQ3333247.1 trigger factor [Planctomycetota bacterium]